jgi:vancomycin resistance protein YoaR
MFLDPSSNKSVQLSLDESGIVPDKQKSVSQLPVSGIVDSAKQAIGGNSGVQHFPIVFAWKGAPTEVAKLMSSRGAKVEPARVFYVDGRFDIQPEKGDVAIDEKALEQKTIEAAENGGTQVTVPVIPASKRISENQLKQIDEVISTFTTKFPVRKKDRNTNIRIASGKINGFVLLPGDTFSFNTVVGKRTIQDGFKTAPVFKNGKHDMGVGGGICQVSSTLYNAALFADLHIVQRHNHSMPVAYLPLGRDATVDYGSLDMAFKNSLSIPIAISADYEPGKLTFRILGKKDPSQSIKIESEGSKTWDNGTKTVPDPSLLVGTKKVVDKGSRGHSLLTYRVVYKDGVETNREPLGRSYYKGAERVVDVGTKPTSMIPGLSIPASPVQQAPARPNSPVPNQL